MPPGGYPPRARPSASVLPRDRSVTWKAPPLVGMDGDAARACLARLREPDRQHAVPKLGLRLALRRPGETHHAPELPLASLPAVIGRVLRGLGERPLASQDQGVVLHRELEVLGPDARQLGLDHVVLPRVEQVDGRVERRRALGTERPLEHALELALQLRERVTIADRHGPPPVTTDAKGKPGSVAVNPAARLSPGSSARARAATPRAVSPTRPGSRACRSPGRARRRGARAWAGSRRPRARCRSDPGSRKCAQAPC